MNHSSSERIVAGLREWIAAAPPGAKLPSTRALVAEYGASPVTVQQALRVLVGRGIVETRPGVGTFVRAVRTARTTDHGWQAAALGAVGDPAPQVQAALRTPPNDLISLHAGYPDRELLPERLVRAAFGRAGRDDSAVVRPPTAGLPELQTWFAAELGSAGRADVAPPAASDVLVLPGSQSGLGTIFRAIVGTGGTLLMESPSYWGAIQAAAQVGVRVVPIPSSTNGPDPETLERAFRRTGARAFYAQPNFANPHGAQWTPELVDRVLDVVRANGAFLVEDDWAHDFGIETRSAPVAARDDSGHVVYLRSLTKSVSPAVRVAGLVARGPVRDRLLADAQAQSMYVSGALQTIAHDVVTQPAWRTHLRGVRHQLAVRRDLLVAALREHAQTARLDLVPKGGLNLWLRLPDGTDAHRLARDCEDLGVVVAPGQNWFPDRAPGAYLRLNYSGPDPAFFAEGARIIGAALALQRVGEPG